MDYFYSVTCCYLTLFLNLNIRVLVLVCVLKLTQTTVLGSNCICKYVLKLNVEYGQPIENFFWGTKYYGSNIRHCVGPTILWRHVTIISAAAVETLIKTNHLKSCCNLSASQLKLNCNIITFKTSLFSFNELTSFEKLIHGYKFLQ